jgi:hypothetical protein
MREKGTTEGIIFDPEIERTLQAKLRAKRLTQTSTLKDKETLTDSLGMYKPIHHRHLGELWETIAGDPTLNMYLWGSDQQTQQILISKVHRVCLL